MSRGMKLTLIFPSDEARDAFIGWYLDGGGEQGFYDSQEMRDEPGYSSRPVGKHWDWQERDAGPKRKPPLPEYRIRMVKL